MADGTNDKTARIDAQWSALMAAAQDGDRIAYVRLLHDCSPLIRSVVCCQGVQANRVDDVMQEVLLTVHRARRTYDPARSFSAWLCAISRQRAIDALRRSVGCERREFLVLRELKDQTGSPAEWQHETTAGMERDAVGAAVEQLPDGQHETVEARALQHLPQAARARPGWWYDFGVRTGREQRKSSL